MCVFGQDPIIANIMLNKIENPARASNVLYFRSKLGCSTCPIINCTAVNMASKDAVVTLISGETFTVMYECCRTHINFGPTSGHACIIKDLGTLAKNEDIAAAIVH